MPDSLSPPRLPRRILAWIGGRDRAFGALRDLEDLYLFDLKEIGPRAARRRYRRQAAAAAFGYLRNQFFWSFPMLNNYLKIAWRNITRRKGLAFLNIFGLSVGLAVCLSILIYYRHETSYDDDHEFRDRIVRFEPRFLNPDGSVRGGFATLAPGFVPLLETDFPAVEKIARLVSLSSFGDTFVTNGESVTREPRVFLADAALFEIFSLPLVEGDSRSALSEPNTVVLSSTTARRYFPDSPALGRMLKLENRISGPILVRIAGVMKDAPLNSHFHCDILGSLASVKAVRSLDAYFYGTTNLTDNVAYIYARLAPGASAASLEASLPAFLDRVLPTRTTEDGQTLRPSSRYGLIVRPVSEIHLQARNNNEIEPGGDPKMLSLFILIAGLILAVACINFVNLATARASKRAREVGLRKVVGGRRKTLAFQFMLESVMIVFVSMVAGLALARLTLPAFSSMAGRPLSFAAVLEPGSLLILAGVFLLASLVSGLYPAAYISGFRPAAILRGELTRGSRGALFRKIMVVFQFAVSVVLIIGVGVVGRQMRFLREVDLGFDRENVILMPVSSEIIGSWEDVHRELAADTAVLDASLSKRAPSGSLQDAPGFLATVNGTLVRSSFSMPHNRVSREFFRTYRMRFVAGRDFSEDFPTDATEAFVLNETAVRRLGWASPEEAVGRPFSVAGGRNGRVIGVTADFNYESLHKEIVPIVTYIVPGQANTLSVRLAAGRVEDGLNHVRSVWNRYRPGFPFEFDFLDDRLNGLYQNEERMMRMFRAFSGLAVLVACLGLFGLASYAAEQRIREIGIRKVMGASAGRIVAMFSAEFGRWICAAILLAWPVGYVLMKKWLGGFAYKTSIGWAPFIVSAVLAIAIALATVVSRTLRAASANPAESLRHE
ncbi:MAG: ABC transporter permease [Candidatus Aminicenantes bacterium]|nr:ABC transporter permease [Candidatus Aminicenantes bacterium]